MRKIMDSVCNFNQQSEVFPGLFLSCHMGNGPGSLRQSPGKTKNVLQGERERVRDKIKHIDSRFGRRQVVIFWEGRRQGFSALRPAKLKFASMKR